VRTASHNQANTCHQEIAMCLSRPNIPPPPPPPQELKQPDTSAMMNRRRNRQPGAMMGGSMLTGPSGVNPATMTTGRVSLLGQ
jgi:hypothetical protein